MTGNTATVCAVLGLGAMGSRIAKRLLAAGHDVVVWNRSPAGIQPLLELGARAAASPREAAAQAVFVLSSVTDDDASRAVWLDDECGALHGLAAGRVAIELSTLSPSWVTTLAAAVHGRGADLVDAPVVGSRPQADAGQLVILVGGSAAAYARVQPLLAVFGIAVHHVGATGDGAKLKLAVNALFAAQVAAYAELTGWLLRDGLSPAAVSVIGTLAVMSPALNGAAHQMSTHRYPPLFPVALASKDLRYLVQSAGSAGSAVPLSTAAHAQFAAAVSRGLGADNIAGVAQLYR